MQNLVDVTDAEDEALKNIAAGVGSEERKNERKMIEKRYRAKKKFEEDEKEYWIAMYKQLKVNQEHEYNLGD